MECGHQLLLMAFLQRIINGGGRIDREMALARGRADLNASNGTKLNLNGMVKTGKLRLWKCDLLVRQNSF